MPRNKKYEGDMTEIGTVRTPPFAKVPDIHSLFEDRHNRFERLAPTSPIQDYIIFLSHFTKAQQETANHFNQVELPLMAAEKAKEFGMPPIDRQSMISHKVFEKITEYFLNHLSKSALNEQSLTALKDTLANKAEWKEWAKNILDHRIPPESLAHHIFITGALQVIFSISASKNTAKDLRPIEGNLCPSCGGTHSASIVVGWGESEGTRFCSCLYCGTLWHYVRIKCTFCDATGGIEYREIEGGPGTVHAETCKTCLKYCKIVDHSKDVSFDVFADDIGSIALDLLMKNDDKFVRGAFNPFLVGY